jgi:hypothetical protein
MTLKPGESAGGEYNTWGLINAVIGDVEASTHVSGNPTNQAS